MTTKDQDARPQDQQPRQEAMGADSGNGDAERMASAIPPEVAKQVRVSLEAIVAIGCTLDGPGEPRTFCKEDGSAHSIYCAAFIAKKALAILALSTEPQKP